MTPLYVGIPVYNGAATIGATLENLLQQTHRDFTVVVYDDGSSDATCEIVRGMAARDSRIRLTEGGANRGRGHARNRLLQLTADGLLAWQDADDSWHPRKLEEQLAAYARLSAAEGRDLVLLSSYRQRQVKEEGSLDLEKQPPERYDLAFVLSDAYRGCPFQLQASLGPARCFAEAGGFDDALNWSEDVDLLLKLLRAGVPVLGHHASEPLATYNHSYEGAEGAVVERAQQVIRDRFRDYAAAEGFDLDRIYRRRAANYLARIYRKEGDHPAALRANLQSFAVTEADDERQLQVIADNLLQLVDARARVMAAKEVDRRRGPLLGLLAKLLGGR